MHSYLRESGVDGVKVDAQSLLGMLGDGAGGGSTVARAFIHAVEDSVLREFSADADAGPRRSKEEGGAGARRRKEEGGTRKEGKGMEGGGERGSRSISCMCHASECLWSYRSSNLIRASGLPPFLPPAWPFMLAMPLFVDVAAPFMLAVPPCMPADPLFMEAARH
eukprot:1569768-Rhodomonas_salina.1